MKNYLIRCALAAEAALMPDLETEAARLYETVGLPQVAELPAQDIGFYRACIAGGSLWVAVPAADPDSRPVGFAAAALRDGNAWLAELDVVPAHGNRGIGRDLVSQVFGWACGNGLQAVVLTTFRDIPFNGPFYRKLGFRPVARPRPPAPCRDSPQRAGPRARQDASAHCDAARPRSRLSGFAAKAPYPLRRRAPAVVGSWRG